MVKDLSFWVSVKVDESEDDEGDGPESVIFVKRVYLSLPPDMALDPDTFTFLRKTATNMLEDALKEVRATYKPEEVV